MITNYNDPKSDKKRFFFMKRTHSPLSGYILYILCVNYRVTIRIS